MAEEAEFGLTENGIMDEKINFRHQIMEITEEMIKLFFFLSFVYLFSDQSL